jgi:hypothetical protein
MTKLADSVRDLAYTTAGVQILTYDRIVGDLDRRFDLGQRAALAREKAKPTFERLTKPAESLAARFSPTQQPNKPPRSSSKRTSRAASAPARRSKATSTTKKPAASKAASRRTSAK